MPLPLSNRNTLLQFTSILCLGLAPLWLYLLLFPEGYDYFNGIVVLVIAIVVNGGLILHVSKENAKLRRIMTIGFFVKLMGAAGYLTLMLRYYHGGDIFSYFTWGSEIARNIREYGEIGGLRGEFVIASGSALNGTSMLIIFVGGLFSVIGPTLSGTIVIFSSISYWGSFFFWKAFVRAFPDSDSELAAIFLYFMPSLVFWTATLGKDALMYFFIGLVSFGLCQGIYGARGRALLYLGVGILGTAIIRAHIAGILALSISAVFLTSKNRAGLPGALARICLVPILVFGTYYTLANAKQKLGVSDAAGVAKYTSDWNNATQYGGSSFESGSFAKRLILSPTLPFRPFPWEVNSIQTALACAEGMLLFGLLYVNRKSLKNSVLHWRSDAFIGFILLFSFETSAALSSAFSNFGLLARERVMFTPLLMLLVPAYRKVQVGIANSSNFRRVLLPDRAPAAQTQSVE